MPRKQQHSSYYLIFRFYAGLKELESVKVPLHRALTVRESHLLWSIGNALKRLPWWLGFGIMLDTTLAYEPRTSKLTRKGTLQRPPAKLRKAR